MNWQIVLMLNIAFYVVAWILIKLIVNKLPRAQALSFQFFLCALAITLYNLITHNFRFSNDASYVIPIGGLVAFGAYAQWQAIDFSLSKTSLFSPLANILAIALAVIFLGEFAEWNFFIASGLVLSFLAIFLFRSSNRGNRRAETSLKRWLFFFTVMILIFGTTTFLRKVLYFIPLQQWLFYWYLGAFLGSLPFLYLEKQNPFHYPGKLIFLVPLSSLVILGQLATHFWAIDLTLISRVESFRGVSIVSLPMLAGWFIFREKQGLSKKEILAFLIAIIGALLIIFS